MCEDCVTMYGGDGVPITDPMINAAWLIRDLYNEPGCGAGGPLHVVLDDYNLENDFLELYEGRPMTDRARELGDGIISYLRPMNLAERAATIGLARGELTSSQQ